MVHSDGTVVFTFGTPRGGSALTLDLAARHGKPSLHVDLGRLAAAAAARRLGAWIEREGVAILNVAGSRESDAEGMRVLVLAIVKEAFRPTRRGPTSGAATRRRRRPGSRPRRGAGTVS